MIMALKRNYRDKGISSRSKGKGKAPSRVNNSNPIDIIFRDDMHKSRYEALVKCKIVNTCYLDDHVLDIFGIKDDVYWMLGRVGWVTFTQIKCPTYIPL